MKKYLLFLFCLVFAGCASAKKDNPVVNPPVVQNGESQIVQDETKITFIDENGNKKEEIALINTNETRNELIEGTTVAIEYHIATVALKCDTSNYIAIVQNASIANDDQDIGKTTFKYYNKKGELLWQKDNFDINCIYNSPNIISSDGTRILFTKNDPFLAMILNEKGEEVMNLGEFSYITGQFITKNGKYGCIKFEKYASNEDGKLFLDVVNKKAIIDNNHGYIKIGEDGKAEIFIILESIDIMEDGKIEFFDKNGNFQFEGYIDKLTNEQKSMLKADELEEIKRIIDAKKEDHILREKVVYEYQFR